MNKTGVKILALLGAIYLYIAAWEGNVGKALACIFAPAILTVDDDAQNQSTDSVS